MGEELFCKESKSKGKDEKAGIFALCFEPLCLKELLSKVTDMSLNIQLSCTSQVCNSHLANGEIHDSSACSYHWPEWKYLWKAAQMHGHDVRAQPSSPISVGPSPLWNITPYICHTVRTHVTSHSLRQWFTKGWPGTPEVQEGLCSFYNTNK